MASQMHMVNRMGGLTGEIEWYTPRQYLDAASKVMGGIFLDPASSKAAQTNVKAEHYFTQSDDGLKQPWASMGVWLNPPYDALTIAAFVDKLIAEYTYGRTHQAIMLTNNATDTLWFHRAWNACAACCFTRGRIRFLKGRDGSMQEKSAPTHGQAFFYFGPDVKAFEREFRLYGFIAYPKGDI
jgi:phage N-6-adenine-methyltransferase